MKVLIDTSAWIDFFRNTGGAAGDVVAELIQLDQAYLTDTVMAELLHGAKGKQEMKSLEAVFATIPILDVTGEDWLATGNTLQALRKKGCTVPLTDVLIASVAQRNDMAVLTLDKDFEYLSVECVKILEGS
ncbi:MAG: PIN domain-containing protein [Candidatus Electrothrix aestuarii]|uniref:Ribonuclease VapC n=1 Tax=Candidatus Electrothrix aestuarii TaxID=3062594 RepID=A0AAU8LP83_9BACT|nr:PIN domain-containing protein [Candidatus Electrothrix aestuarii]